MKSRQVLGLVACLPASCQALPNTPLPRGLATANTPPASIHASGWAEEGLLGDAVAGVAVEDGGVGAVELRVPLRWMMLIGTIAPSWLFTITSVAVTLAGAS
jgi:hypothetical protein